MTLEKLQDLLGISLYIKADKGCWLIKNTDWSNYTRIKGESGHRLVYKLCNGPLIGGKEICHKCDRKGCINPEHLFQGSHSDNIKDAINKKRVFGIHVGLNKIPKELREKDRIRKLARFVGQP